jgi:RNA polymerase sigma factor (sigma-70 family)
MRGSSLEEHVEDLRAGQPAAWQQFMKEQGRVILAVGRRVGLDANDREELFQNTCLIAYRSIEQLRDASRLSSWVYSIAYRTGIELARKRKQLGGPDDPELERLASTEPSPEQILERIETSRNVRQSLDKIGDTCRDLLDLLYLHPEEPSYEEISRRLSMPIGSIGPTRARCLEKLRKALTAVSGCPKSGTTAAEDPDRSDRSS